MIGPLFAAKKLLVYKSGAKILITPNSNQVAIAGQQAETTVKTWFADEATLRTLISSQDLLDTVIEETHIKATWTELRERILLEILSNSGNQVSLLEIAVIADRPEESRVLALTISQRFIQYVQQLSAAEHDKTVAFLERERRNAEREVARAQKRLLKVGIVPQIAGREDPTEQAWVQLQDKRSELERDEALASAELEQLSVLTPGDSPEGVRGGDPLGESVARERVKLAELRETYQDRAPQVKAQQEKLARLEQVYNDVMQARVNGERQGASRKLARIRELLTETEKRLKKLEAARPSPEKHLEYATQERQLAMWQENYLDLTRQLYRARVAQQSSRREGAFTIVEKPLPGRLVTGQASEGSPMVRALIGIPLALMCGLALVLAVDYFTASMRLQPRIEEALGLPVIGSIPLVSTALKDGWDQLKGTARGATFLNEKK